MARKNQLPKPKVGQVLHQFPLLRGDKATLSPVVVTRVGRRYFTCSPESDPSEMAGIEYDLETWQERGDPCGSRLYPSPQAHADEVEARAICRELGDWFYLGSNRRQVELATLRRIRAEISKATEA